MNAADVLVVERATPADHAAIADVTALAYEPSGLPPDAPYLAFLRDVAGRERAGARLFVARLGGDVVGTATWCPPGSELTEVARGDESELRVVAVAPDRRGRGIATALIEACLDASREAGHSALVLCSAGWMESAQRLYRRLGFQHLPDRDWVPRPDLYLTAYGYPLADRSE